MTKAIQTAIHRIRRSPYQTVAAISIMTMTLFLASIFLLIAAGSQAILSYFETRPQVNAFFSSDHVPSAEEIQKIKSEVEATGLVQGFTYVSKEEAFAIYKDLNKADPLLLEAVTAQMLPASVEISAKDPKDLKILSEIAKKQTGIEDVRYAEDIVSSLSRWISSVRTVGISLVGAHIIITWIIILLIIGIKVSNRRDEIIIMQLVGATPGYIRGPFVWEGIIYGLIGAIFAWLISYVVLLSSMDFLNTFLSGIPLLPVPFLFMLELLGVEVLAGVLVGGLGGIIATRRFLRA